MPTPCWTGSCHLAGAFLGMEGTDGMVKDRFVKLSVSEESNGVYS